MSVFPTKIVLATDGSEDAALAARAAVDICKKTGSELHLVHVWHDVPTPYAHAMVRTELESQGREVLEEQVKKVEAAGGTVAGAHLREGRISDEIVKLSGRLGAGLLVVGSRGMGKVKRLLLGSHSEDIVHHCKVPVLVLRRGENVWPPERVVIGEDSSEDARRAGELAASIGGLFGARGVLVHAMPKGSREDAERAEQALREVADRLEGSLGSRPEIRAVPGDPTDVILEAAGENGATLVAVGSRGLSAPQRARLGSTSTKIVRLAPGAVLVCPHPAPER